MRLRPRVLEALARHGLTPAPGDTPEGLKERLNETYLDEVRRLREQRVGGTILPREYASHVQALKERYPLLGLPVSLWTEPNGD